MSKEAMQLALEALESLKVTVSSRTEANVIDGVDLFPTQIAALRQALANEALDKMAENARELGLNYEPAQQEPVAWISKSKNLLSWDMFYDDMTPLYTSPPAQRTWVGLTDAERKLVRNSVGYNQFVTAGEYAEHVQKATEFKLREKNNG